MPADNNADNGFGLRGKNTPATEGIEEEQKNIIFFIFLCLQIASDLCKLPYSQPVLIRILAVKSCI